MSQRSMSANKDKLLQMSGATFMESLICNYFFRGTCNRNVSDTDLDLERANAKYIYIYIYIYGSKGRIVEVHIR